MGFAALVVGLIINKTALIIVGALTYTMFTIAFILKRLRPTSKSYKHTTEMIATSLIIPFLSVYWTIYGAIKYRVLFY